MDSKDLSKTTDKKKLRVIAVVVFCMMTSMFLIRIGLFLFHRYEKPVGFDYENIEVFNRDPKTNDTRYYTIQADFIPDEYTRDQGVLFIKELHIPFLKEVGGSQISDTNHVTIMFLQEAYSKKFSGVDLRKNAYTLLTKGADYRKHIYEIKSSVNRFN